MLRLSAARPGVRRVHAVTRAHAHAHAHAHKDKHPHKHCPRTRPRTHTLRKHTNTAHAHALRKHTNTAHAHLTCILAIICFSDVTSSSSKPNSKHKSWNSSSAASKTQQQQGNQPSVGEWGHLCGGGASVSSCLSSLCATHHGLSRKSVTTVLGCVTSLPTSHSHHDLTISHVHHHHKPHTVLTMATLRPSLPRCATAPTLILHCVGEGEPRAPRVLVEAGLRAKRSTGCRVSTT
jgi:hypothetical protein